MRASEGERETDVLQISHATIAMFIAKFHAFHGMPHVLRRAATTQ